jgi:hypothetical protein
MSFHARALLPALVALALFGCADSPRRTDDILAPPSLDISAARTLLECPTSQSASAVGLLGFLGGVVSVGGNSVMLPPGAVSLPTLITLRVPASPYVEVDVTADDLLSFVFRRPVSITIDYSRCPLEATAGATLTVWHIDPQTKALVEPMGGVDDPARRRITFVTGHLSGYAVAQ